MKKGLFLIILLLVSWFANAQSNTPGDTTTMKAYIDSILNENRGVIKRAYHIDILKWMTRYVDSVNRATSGTVGAKLSISDTAAMLTPYINRGDTAAAFAPFIERSDTAAMLAFYRKKSDVVFATDYTGIVNTGVEIDSTNFHAFLVATNGKQVYWPEGTYNLATATQGIELAVDIHWRGVPRKSIINGQNLYVKGNIQLYNMSWDDAGIAWRFDNNAVAPTDTVDFIAHGVYFRHSQMFIRNAGGSNPQIFNRVEIIGFEHDTINSSVSGGAFIQWDQDFGSILIEDGLIHHNTDSNYVSIIRISGKDSEYRRADTTVIIRNVEFTDLWVNATTAPAPVTSKLLMTINGEGSRVLTEGIRVSHVNLPQFDIRGSGSQTILRNWQVEVDKVVSTATNTDYFLINKSRGYRYDWATIIEGCNIELKFGSGPGGGGNISLMYLENNGNRIIRNSQILTEGFTGMTGIRVLSGETPGFYNRFVVKDSEIRSYGPDGKQAFWITDDIHYVEMSNTTIEGSESIYGQENTSETAEEFRFFNTTFLGGFQTVNQRDVRRMYFNSCTFNGNDLYNFTSTEKTLIQSCLFVDDSITVPTINSIDVNFEFGSARTAEMSGNTFDLNRLRRIGTIDHETYSTGLDTLIFNNNKGTINGRTNSIQILTRPASVDYYEAVGNRITFGGAAASSRPNLIYAETAIGTAHIANNRLLMANGGNIDVLVLGTATISSLRAFNNTGFTTFNSGNTITYANMAASGLEDMSGNVYLTEATGYTQTQVNDTLAFYDLIPDVITAGTSRNLAASDVENIVRCTTSITLTIPLNFSDMAVEQTITVLKAFAGTNITITGATGVTVNGSSGGSVTISGDYKAGIIYKAATNTYEVY